MPTAQCRLSSTSEIAELFFILMFVLHYQASPENMLMLQVHATSNRHTLPTLNVVSETKMKSLKNLRNDTTLVNT